MLRRQLFCTSLPWKRGPPEASVRAFSVLTGVEKDTYDPFPAPCETINLSRTDSISWIGTMKSTSFIFRTPSLIFPVSVHRCKSYFLQRTWFSAGTRGQPALHADIKRLQRVNVCGITRGINTYISPKGQLKIHLYLPHDHQNSEAVRL